MKSYIFQTLEKIVSRTLEEDGEGKFSAKHLPKISVKKLTIRKPALDHVIF